LIIDEAAMVDTATLHELLSEIFKLQPDGCRILLVGDSGQLPPVGFGAVFHNLVQKPIITSQLTRPLRQINGSSIPLVAGQIRAGEVPDIPTYLNQANGVYFVEANAKTLVARASNVYRQLRNSKGVKDVMVCAARNQTVDAFNKTMSAENWEIAKQLGLYARVYPGDPIICTKNHYSSGLFNGMLGVVRDIENDVMVNWEGSDIDPHTGGPVLQTVPLEAAIDIRLAYAITCHKSQGSSAKAVIVVLEDTSFLTREWLYTAITRAETQVIIIGSKDALRMSVERRTKRVTGFNFLCPADAA
jgi:exodeoxyribonuclease V alpha subunit